MMVAYRVAVRVMAKPKPKKDDSQLTVVAELTLTHADGTTEIVRSFDKAWHRMREIGETSLPVKCRLNGFVHKTDEEISA
jgi:hypothetical protein